MFATNVSVSLTEDDMFISLRSVLLTIVDMPVIQGQQNGVALPADPNFMVMTTLGIDNLSTTRSTYDAYDVTSLGSETQTKTTRWRVQLDTYGSEAASISNAIAAIFRSEWCCEAFKNTGYPVRPTYAGSPRNAVFINASSQYEDRYSMDIEMLIDAEVTLPQYFFNAVSIETYSVDTL